MPRPNLLTDEQIELSMKGLPFWSLDGNKIVREISAANFVAIIGIVNAIAVLAEKHDHHPDMLIYGWNKLRITLSTHDRGGLTEFDFKLAIEIENLSLS
jgi:4a-hydroxytetrahydrobiopterin dehydratase